MMPYHTDCPLICCLSVSASSTQTLHKELAPLDQDLIDTSSLDAVKKELVSPSLLQAKDKGVKALTACCIADLLRLYAPDAPYTEAQLTVSNSPLMGRVTLHGPSYLVEHG